MDPRYRIHTKWFLSLKGSSAILTMTKAVKNALVVQQAVYPEAVGGALSIFEFGPFVLIIYKRMNYYIILLDPGYRLRKLSVIVIPFLIQKLEGKGCYH